MITSVLKMGGFLGIPVDLTHNYQATKTALIKSSLDVAFVQILQAGSLFVMINYVHEASSGIYSKVRCILEYDLLNRFITSISKASYGMYLMNNTFKLVLTTLLAGLVLSKMHGILLWILTVILVFIVSWLIVYLISKIPYLDRFSGYH